MQQRTLSDIIERNPTPRPWEDDANKIPWHDDAFSERMLLEHLSQEHDAASRRAETIARQVAWIDDAVLGHKPSRVLDLGCGPGLYTSALSVLGHACAGIDFAPAAIDYARRMASERGDTTSYVLGDVRDAEYGGEYDMVMMIYGELNVFSPADASTILAKTQRALRRGGIVLLEVHTFAAVRAMGAQAPAWRSQAAGLFSASPHLILEDSFWVEPANVAVTRHYVIDVATAHVDRFGQCVQAYSDDGYDALLASAGFTLIERHGSLTGAPESDDLVVLTAHAS